MLKDNEEGKLEVADEILEEENMEESKPSVETNNEEVTLNINYDNLEKKDETVNNIILEQQEETPDITGDQVMLELGKKAEEGKIKHRRNILIFLCFVISFQLMFINGCIYIMMTRVTYIQGSVFKYFISGAFINLVTIFNGVTKYLYNDKSSSLFSFLRKK